MFDSVEIDLKEKYLKSLHQKLEEISDDVLYYIEHSILII